VLWACHGKVRPSVRWLSHQVLNGLPVSLRRLTLDGGTGVRKFHSGFPPTAMQLSHLTRLTRLTLRNFAW